MIALDGTILVTGAGGGLGRAIAAHVSPELPVTMASTHSVREFAAAIKRRMASREIPPARALVLNAGLLEFEGQTWTAGSEGGFDTSFASNYLGHWLLTFNAAAEHGSGSYSGELQQRLARDPFLDNITTIGVDPGTMSTGIVRNSNWFVRNIVHGIMIATLARVIAVIWSSPNGALRTPEKSAKDVVDAALAPKWQNGGLYLNGSELADVSEEAKNIEKRALVWQDSVRYTQLKEEETMLVNWK
ncbi:hypothetical protein DL767_008178 [Monosporascus sp. MG133]|nr:hypothetical protein DL767_008178 [Monosporascus sp. MG133]